MAITQNSPPAGSQTTRRWFDTPFGQSPQRLPARLARLKRRAPKGDAIPPPPRSSRDAQMTQQALVQACTEQRRSVALPKVLILLADLHLVDPAPLRGLSDSATYSSK